MFDADSILLLYSSATAIVFRRPFCLLGVISGSWFVTQRYDWRDWCIFDGQR
jgi:hypothetical protein